MGQISCDFWEKTAEAWRNERKANYGSFESLPVLFQNLKLKVIDHRSKGGALWVVGGQELKPFLDELFRREGIFFRFMKGGGKASGNKPAWFTKELKG